MLMMRAREILQKYEKGKRNFQGANLRGLSFKGEDLSDADFSFTDIRGANFRGANLTRAKFCGAKAGLQKRQVVVLLTAVLVLVSVSASFNVLVSVFILLNFENTIAGWVSLIPIIMFWIVFFYQGIEDSTGAVAVPFVITVIFAGSFLWIIDRTKVTTFAGAFAAAVAVPFTFAGAVAGAVAVGGAFTGAIIFVFAVAFTGAFIFLFTMAFDFNGIVAGSVTLCQTLLSFYLAYLVMKGDKKYATIRNRVVVCASIGGTSFRDASLKDADFTNATLKSTDFREANIIRTCWKNTVKLDRIRLGKTYLKDAKVRELARTGKGMSQDFSKADLRGANLSNADLSYANLIQADLSQATLSQANLEGSNLTEINAIGTDLTQAILTAACIEAWNTDSNTRLDDINCDYIYLLNQQQERRPSSGIFVPGEFTKLFEEVFNTVDLIFQDGVNWKAFVSAFDQVKVENEGIELTVQSIENKGDGVIVVKVQVPLDANKENIHSDFSQNYELKLQALEREYKKQLKIKESEIDSYKRESANMMEIAKILANKTIPIEVTTVATSESSTEKSTKNVEVEMNFQEKVTVAVGKNENNQTVSGNKNNITAQSNDSTFNQNQQSTDEQITATEVVEMLAYLEEKIQNLAALSEVDREKSVKRLEVAKVEVQESKPDKNSIAKSIKRVNETLNGAGKTTKEVKDLVNELFPTVTKVAEYLGYAVGTIWNMLP